MLQVSLFKKQAYRTIILYIQTDPSNGLELSRALDDVLRKSNELRSLAGQKNNVFLPAKVGLAGDPPTEQELLSLFYQQCLKHGSWGSA